MHTDVLMSRLGVSRNWINDHMREELGKRIIVPGKGTRINLVVDYAPDDVVAWLNENATFDRQTIRLSYSYFGLITDAEAKRRLEKIADIEDIEARIKARKELYDYCVPQEIRDSDCRESNERKRVDPWIIVPEAKITSIAQLMGLKDILSSLHQKSPEMAYRYIYRNGMIRITVRGRVWYMDDCNRPTGHALLLPAELIQPKSHL